MHETPPRWFVVDEKLLDRSGGVTLDHGRGDNVGEALIKTRTVRIVSFPRIVIFDVANRSTQSIPECHDGGERQSRGVLGASLS